MDIEINTKSREPIYAQIERQILDAIRFGKLKSGQLLPPVRQLAIDLMINPNTVAKVYKILESQKIVRGARRHGTIIEENAAIRISQNNELNANLEIETLLRSLSDCGISAGQVKNILFDQIERIEIYFQKKDARQISFKGKGFSKKLSEFFRKNKKGL